MATRSYDDWKLDVMDIEYKKFCEGEDFNPIKDPKDAVHTLYEEMFEGAKFNEIAASQALQCLIKHHKMQGYEDVDFDHPNVVTYQAMDVLRQSHKRQMDDLKKAMGRHLDMLKKELYGKDELDMQTINGAIGNLEWLCDQNISEKKVNVRRA